MARNSLPAPPPRPAVLTCDSECVHCGRRYQHRPAGGCRGCGGREWRFVPTTVTLPGGGRIQFGAPTGDGQPGFVKLF